MVNISRRKIILIVGVLVPFLLIFAHVLRVVVDPLLFDRPQVESARYFVLSHKAFVERGGEISNVELDKSNSRLSEMSDKVEGSYEFSVTGPLGTEKIRVTWSSLPDGSGFVGKELHVLAPWTQAEQIWP